MFKLDLNERFPRLSRAPIVEAVIHWQARAEKPLEHDALKRELAARLPNYPRSDAMHGFGLKATLSPKDHTSIVQHSPKGFVGLRLTSDDGRYVMQFTREGLSFSRTSPYEHWEPFAAAAKQAWQVFKDVAAPVETQRLGVRYINQLAQATSATLRDYLRDPPQCPLSLPLNEFMYHSTFNVPGLPYGIGIIKVMQPSMSELPQSSGLFIDIDVFSTTAIPNQSGPLEDSLARMRWLKNKVFFSLLTDAALDSLR